jgi:hypothetical protein
MDEIGDITKPDPETLGKLVYDVVDAKNILEHVHDNLRYGVILRHLLNGHSGGQQQ